MYNHLRRFSSTSTICFDEVSGKKYVNLLSIDERVKKLPFAIRILLENAIRRGNHSDVETLLNAETSAAQGKEIQFHPSRIVLQDFTGVPAFVDLVSMRNAIPSSKRSMVNPVIPVDFIVDHSIMVDSAGSQDSLRINEEIEFERNKERFQFMKWASKNFKNTRVVPPGVGIIHQVNVELLAQVVSEWTAPNAEKWYVPDTVLGTDSHTPMVNGLGVVGWGVGGIEALGCMLGESTVVTVPPVVRVRFEGQLAEGVTATDLALHMTNLLRKYGVVGRIVEFENAGGLSVEDRCTVANMAPEYGATMGYFPPDQRVIDYLLQTGRPCRAVEEVKRMVQKMGLWSEGHSAEDSADRSEPLITVDLSRDVVPLVAGPKRPQDKVAVRSLKAAFEEGLTANKSSWSGYGLESEHRNSKLAAAHKFGHGSVVLAAITSCTNTSNHALLVTAGLIAKAANEKKLAPPTHVRPSFSPGSKAAGDFMLKTGLLSHLEALRFHITGYGCMTCCGNSGPLNNQLEERVEREELVVAAVLSGNRNFEGRVHPVTRANYLASPPLVVAFALAGRVNIDFESEPIGFADGNLECPVFLRDLWPTDHAVRTAVKEAFVEGGEQIRSVYERAMEGGDLWRQLTSPSTVSDDEGVFQFDPSSSYLKLPPFVSGSLDPHSHFSGLTGNLFNARALLVLGDSITTDHISPAGSIGSSSPAGKYLTSVKQVEKKDMNAYGARRGHDEVMARGSFANARLKNLALKDDVAKSVGSFAKHVPSGVVASPFEVAEMYKQEGSTPLIIIGGKEYGSGSSRDWAAKGPRVLGVRAVIAESFERIHRSNLCGIGVVPLQVESGEEDALRALRGDEEFDVLFADDAIRVGGQAQLVAKRDGRHVASVSLRVRIDTERELEYVKNGNVMGFFLKNAGLISS